MDRRATAIHEAGHAVIGRALGLTCGEASIITDDDSVGHSIQADPWRTLGDWEQRGHFRASESALRGRIMTLMAGAEAEAVLLGRCQGGDGDDRYEIDLTVASGEAGVSLRDQWDEYEPRFRRQARRLIRFHRDKIECVVEALIERGTLQPDEVDALVSGSGNSPAM